MSKTEYVRWRNTLCRFIEFTTDGCVVLEVTKTHQRVKLLALDENITCTCLTSLSR